MGKNERGKQLADNLIKLEVCIKMPVGDNPTGFFNCLHTYEGEVFCLGTEGTYPSGLGNFYSPVLQCD